MPLVLRIMHKYKKNGRGAMPSGFSLLLRQCFFYANAALLGRAIYWSDSDFV